MQKRIPQVIQRGNHTIFISYAAFKKRKRAEQPQREELQRTVHPNGVIQTQQNIEVRRCRVKRSQ